MTWWYEKGNQRSIPRRGISLSEGSPGDSQNNIRLSCQAEASHLRVSKGRLYRRGLVESGIASKHKGLRNEGCDSNDIY